MQEKTKRENTKMAKYVVYKHRFYYNKSRYNDNTGATDVSMVGPCTLEFIVPTDVADKDKLTRIAKDTLREFSSATTKTDDGLSLYNFGCLDVIEFIDDLMKVFKLNIGKTDIKMHFWLDENPEFSYWVSPEC